MSFWLLQEINVFLAFLYLKMLTSALRHLIRSLKWKFYIEICVFNTLKHQKTTFSTWILSIVSKTLLYSSLDTLNAIYVGSSHCQWSRCMQKTCYICIWL